MNKRRRNSKLFVEESEMNARELELKEQEINLLRAELALKKKLDTSEVIPNAPPMVNTTTGSTCSNTLMFSFKDIEDSLNPFTGDDDYPIEKWISEFEDASSCAGWNDVHKNIFARRLLKGTARESLRMASDLKSWGNLADFLRKEFKKTENSAVVHRKMLERKKKNDESFKSYLIALMEIASAANIEDAAIIQYCIDGIRDYEPNKSILYGCSSMDEFKAKLQIYQEIKNKTTNKNSGSINSMDNSRARNNSSPGDNKLRPFSSRRNRRLQCFNCLEFGHISESCPDKSKGEKCFICKNFGHNSKTCDKVDTKKSNACVTCLGENTVLEKNVKQIKIGDSVMFAMVDSGSDLNFISQSRYNSLGAPNFNGQTIVFNAVGSKGLSSVGQFQTKISIEDDNYITNFHIVLDGVLPCDILLGKELIDQTITTITPNSISMKKFVPANCVLAVSRGDVTLNLNHIGEEAYRDEIRNLIIDYNPRKTVIGSEIKMKIVLTDEKPIEQKPRRLSPMETKIVRDQVDEWIEEGIVRPSKSCFASPVVLANKKDGSKRLCIDYRKLNEVVIKDRYPLPLIDDQIDQLQGATYFSTLDLKNGFFHVPIEEDSIKYTAFVTPFGLFEFLRAPFGLCNSPAVFQRFVNNIFNPLCIKKIVCLYLDDLIVPGSSEREALERLREVLKTAEKNGLQIKWSKCQFLSKSIEYLGYEIENGNIEPSGRKKLAISKFPEPRNIKQIQRFLGLTGYFRRFVKDYAVLAKPLSDLLRKDVTFKMGIDQRESFEELKKKLISKPVLKIYSVSAETELHTDACKIGLGAVLLQKDDEDQRFHPVFFYSRKTTPCEERYTSYELEVLAIVCALKKFRVYLLGLTFRIITDCAAFKGTMERKELTSRIAGWALQLHEYDYKLEHRPGSRMKHVDALSRGPVLMTIEDDVINRVKAAQNRDEELNLIQKLLETGSYKNYLMSNGILLKNVEGSMKLVVPRQMQNEVIKNYHEQGHFAVKKTEELIERQFYIPKLHQKIQMCIKNCISCILAERKMGKQDGLLNCIPKGDCPLSTYHVDHLGHLVSTQKSYKYVLCVIDGFSKFVWIYPCKTLTSSEVISKLNLQKSTFGNPEYIISDKGTAFTSAEFQEYCHSEGIVHLSTTTGVPTGNGQVERINRIIIPALTKLSCEKPELWYKHTDKLQRFLNNTVQRSINTTPFELLFGTKMRCAEDFNLREVIEREAANIYDESRRRAREAARDQILKVQDENRKNYNRKRRSAPIYNIGDWVVIRRIQFGSGLKLLPKFLGPYKVMKVNGRDRYDVEKVGKSEGPYKTSTSAENMKLYYQGISDEEDEDDLEDVRSSETDDYTGGPSGK